MPGTSAEVYRQHLSAKVMINYEMSKENIDNFTQDHVGSIFCVSKNAKKYTLSLEC